MQQRMRPAALQGRRAPSHRLPKAGLWTTEAARPTEKKARQIPAKLETDNWPQTKSTRLWGESSST